MTEEVTDGERGKEEVREEVTEGERGEEEVTEGDRGGGGRRRERR